LRIEISATQAPYGLRFRAGGVRFGRKWNERTAQVAPAAWIFGRFGRHRPDLAGWARRYSNPNMRSVIQQLHERLADLHDDAASSDPSS
jgi:hypothetical protein